MGLFDGIGEAEIFERGRFLPDGFQGVLEVRRTIAKETIRSGVGFIVEFKIHKTNKPDTFAVGSKCTWFQKMADKTVAFPAILEWAAAIFGLDPSSQKEEIEAEVAPHIQGALTHATDSPGDNDFVGTYLRVSCEKIETRNGKEFTRHTWSPYVEREPEPRDAVDEIGS